MTQALKSLAAKVRDQRSVDYFKSFVLSQKQAKGPEFKLIKEIIQSPAQSPMRRIPESDSCEAAYLRVMLED